MVVVSSEPGAPTLKSQADARKAALERDVREDPLVKAVLERFPGAEIVGVRTRGEMPQPAELPVPDVDEAISDLDFERDDER